MPAATAPHVARPYPTCIPGRRPRRIIIRDSTCDMTAPPMVTVAVAMPPHGVFCPSISWMT